MRSAAQIPNPNKAEPSTPSESTSSFSKVTFCTWFVLIVLGMGWLALYSRTSADDLVYAASLPEIGSPQGSVVAQSENLTVLCFLHPKCPCSVATLNELKTILAEANREATLYFYTPTELKREDWLNTKLVSEARQSPRFHIESDPDGRVADQYKVSTSGTVLMYGTNGKLLFGGGITSARGHTGPCDAGEALRARIVQPQAEAAYTYPAFGCALKSS